MTGVLFLRRISDNRMSGASVMTTAMFEQICGTRAQQNVILVTTMWPTHHEAAMPREDGLRREDELRTGFWKSMIESGAQMERFLFTHQSAWDILDKLPEVRNPLLMQEEMVDYGKSLAQTSAGLTLAGWLKLTMAELRALISKIKKILIREPKDSKVVGHLLIEQRNAEDALETYRGQETLLIGQENKPTRRSLINVARSTLASRSSSRASRHRSSTSASLPALPGQPISAAGTPRLPYKSLSDSHSCNSVSHFHSLIHYTMVLAQFPIRLADK